MKMFIWHDVLTDYTSGMIAVFANSLEEAQEMARKECYSYNMEDFPQDILNNTPIIYDNTAGIEYVVGGG